MAAQCTRRASKSYSCGIHFFEDSKKYPGENYVYFTLTRETARKIFWKDVLKKIDAKFKIGCEFNESRLECKTPWGAQITLIGVDSDEREKEKVLGQKIRWAYGDESAFFNIDLEEMVYDMLLPATADLNGGITLISTTSNRVGSFFHKVTTGEIRGWNVHRWSYLDNPYTSAQVQKVIDKLKNDKPGVENTPGFKQMYLNQWVIDLDALVYKFSRERNLVYKLENRAFKYVIGIDLGFDDASSYSVCAWDGIEKILYVVESIGKSKLDITALAQEIKRLMVRYPGAPLIVDGANKQAVEEIIKRHQIPLISAKKVDKFEHIQIMNSDFLTGSIKLLYDSCTELIEEYEALIWDERKLPEKHVELSSRNNHRCFVAGTKIKTIEGEKNIEDITTLDLVKTSCGYRRVNYLMKDVSDVFTATFSDGTKIRSTIDHPYYTLGDGFKHLSDLTRDDLCLKNKEKCKPLMVLSSIFIQILKAILVVGTLAERSTEKLSDFIDTSTKSLSEKSKKASISITKMGTPRITPLKILSALKKRSICQSTCLTQIELKAQGKQSSLQSQRPQNGISQKKEEHGTGIIVKLFGIEKRQRKGNAQSVKRNILSTSFQHLTKIIKLAVALESVSQKKEEIQALIASEEFAQIVKGNSWLISILSNYAVVYLAQLHTDTKSKSEVYNLNVDMEHEYFANGILVSNCDATLYAWRYAYSYIINHKEELSIYDHRQVNRFWEEEQKKIERERRANPTF